MIPTLSREKKIQWKLAYIQKIPLIQTHIHHICLVDMTPLHRKIGCWNLAKYENVGLTERNKKFLETCMEVLFLGEVLAMKLYRITASFQIQFYG